MKEQITLIAGGGIIGSAIAYFLSKDTNYEGKVLVVERDPSYSKCSTTRSVGSIRQQFSTPENILISKYGFDFLQSVSKELMVRNHRPEIDFVHSSYLMLATSSGYETLQRNIELQNELGANIELMDSFALSAKHPWLNIDGLAGGGQSHSGEGWFDPFSLLVAFRKKAINQGVKFIADEVVATKRSFDRVVSVQFQSQGWLNFDHFVNAAGPFAGELAGQANIYLPVSPKRRNVFVIDCPEKIRDMPLVVDPSSIYVRPEGSYYICGFSPPETDDPDDPTLTVDHDSFEQVLWPKLALRIPQFEQLRVINSWAGHYDYNSFDQNGIVGKHPEIKNYYFANGFSGHGLQQSPAVGRAICELITYGDFRTLDLSKLGYERILNGRKYAENVII